MICSATFALTLLLSQVARALPQAGSASYPPASSMGSTYPSTSSQPYSPYSTTAYYSKTTYGGYQKGAPQYTSSPYASKGSYPPSSSGCPCSTPTPYPPMDKDQDGTSYSSDYYPTSSNCSCYSSTPYYSSQPPSYTSYSSAPYYSSQPPSYTSYSSTPYYSSQPPSYTPYSSSPYYSSQPPSYSTYSSAPYYSSQPPSYTSYSSTPYYSSQPPSYTSYSPPKVKYPPKTTPMPYKPPSKPEKGSNPESNTPSSTLRATYDTTYDNKSGSLNSVACSDGPNGLAARFPTFGDIPSFPFIGGAFDVVWNSPNCGSCWSLTNMATGVSINITAIDSAGSGFNIAQEAFEMLNGGQIGQGVMDVVANKISPSVCGL